jgi:uncharacterized membrane protein YbhN (UPF0104 family)
MGLASMAYLSLTGFLILAGFFLLSIFQRERALALVRIFLRFLPNRIRDRSHTVVESFFDGLSSLPNLKSLFWIFFDSVGVWGIMVIGYWSAFRAFHMDLTWGAACSFLGIVAVGAMLPNAPGFVGTFQLFTQAALSLYGIPKSTSLAFSLVVHALNLLYVGIAGLVFLPMMAMPVRSFLAVSSDTEKTVP